MTRTEIENRLKILKQQLTMINYYPESFEEKLGKEGIRELIDQILDEMISLKKTLDQLN